MSHILFDSNISFATNGVDDWVNLKRGAHVHKDKTSGHIHKQETYSGENGSEVNAGTWLQVFNLRETKFR